MVARVTERSFLPKLLSNLNNTRNRINNFQLQVSTSHKINKASDDPYNIENVIKYKTSLSKMISIKQPFVKA
jgi:flagellin-like hook-associated protein FlgL